MRIHPAIVAQAAATAAVLLDGRFVLGVGSGEALNEHILGDRWPSAGERLEMLEEAVEVIRLLHTGDEVSHHGKHYTVENARIYTLPEQPVPIYVSGVRPAGAEVAGARSATATAPSCRTRTLVEPFRDAGGGEPVQGGFKVCWAPTARTARRTAHRLWANEAAARRARPGAADAGALRAGGHAGHRGRWSASRSRADRTPSAIVERISEFADAGFDEVHVQQIGPDQDAFFEFWAVEIVPELPR